jgi:hypothetical protein
MYQLVWDTPSKNTYETMPLGNGEVALNAWIDEAGTLQFYIPVSTPSTKTGNS